MAEITSTVTTMAVPANSKELTDKLQASVKQAATNAAARLKPGKGEVFNLFGKSNHDGSFSVTLTIKQLFEYGFVDYYNDTTGMGYQRYESASKARSADIAEYVARCIDRDLEPHLYDVLINARSAKGEVTMTRLVDGTPFVMLSLPVKANTYMAIIDGATRFRGLVAAMEHGDIDEDYQVDARLRIGEDVVEECIEFELINGKQKIVRADLANRVIQRVADSLGERARPIVEGEDFVKNEDGSFKMTEEDHRWKLIDVTFPNLQDGWKYVATRMAGLLNEMPESPWKGLIEMPSARLVTVDGKQSVQVDKLDTTTIRAASVINGLKPFLTNKKLQETDLTGDRLTKLLCNAWTAIEALNPDAKREPKTNVLWGAIGFASVNYMLAAVAEHQLTNLKSDEFSWTEAAWEDMLNTPELTEYERWFNGKKGDRESEPLFSYPNKKGPYPDKVGAANQVALAKEIFKGVMTVIADMGQADEDDVNQAGQEADEAQADADREAVNIGGATVQL